MQADVQIEGSLTQNPVARQLPIQVVLPVMLINSFEATKRWFVF
jgi:hypothetical protein